MLLSLFLQYPSADVLEARAGLAQGARALPPHPARRALEPFLAYWESTPPAALLEHYVATFDLQRRSTLYLSYYLFGDRRERGTALVRLRQRYETAGLRPTTRELPDYLPLVLEFAAAAPPEAGEAVLTEYGPALALLHRALVQAGSPYAAVVEALRATLPPLDAQARALAARLAAQGPPAEMVGLEPFVPPALADAHPSGACTLRPRPVEPCGRAPGLDTTSAACGLSADEDARTTEVRR
jgi:nitrate reductase delta subunit